MKKQAKITQITPMYRISYFIGGTLVAQASFTHEWIMEETYKATIEYYDKNSVTMEARKDYKSPWKKVKLN